MQYNSFLNMKEKLMSKLKCKVQHLNFLPSLSFLSIQRDILIEDIPTMFDHPPRLDGFRDDISFSLEIGSLNLRTHFQGKDKYRSSFEYLRWARQIGLGSVKV